MRETTAPAASTWVPRLASANSPETWRALGSMTAPLLGGTRSIATAAQKMAPKMTAVTAAITSDHRSSVATTASSLPAPTALAHRAARQEDKSVDS